MYSHGPPHMAVQKQDDQHEHTFSSYVRIQDVVQKTCLRRWTIGKSGERGSGISVLPVRHDDDADDIIIDWAIQIRIRWNSNQNPMKFKSESYEIQIRIRWNSNQNPMKFKIRILWNSNQNPMKFKSESYEIQNQNTMKFKSESYEIQILHSLNRSIDIIMGSC